MKSIELAFDEIDDEPARLTVYLTSLAHAAFAEGHRAGMAQAAEPKAYLPLQDRIDAIANALYAAGIRGGPDNNGLPRIIAEGIYMNLRRVPQMDLRRTKPASIEQIAAAIRAASPTQETK